MTPMTRTIAFVVVAACSVGLATVTQYATQPPTVAGFENVGELFYPDETMDPNNARGLRVIAYNEETASAKTFSVEFKDGSWRIPSHHFYPADGQDRLAKTASSVIAVQRGALASPRKSDHEQFGVIDPLDDTSTSLKGRGQRITLFQEGDTPMLDFIIGKKYEGQGGGGSYYVRRTDEDATYITNLEIDLSTKFADWIEPDLLKLDRDGLVSLSLKRPLMDKTGNRIVGDEVNELTRAKSSDPWKLDKLDEKTEELNEDDVRSTVTALDDLKIVGVRPRPRFQDKPLLTADLVFNPPEAIAKNPQVAQTVFNQVQTDLASKGFFLFEDKEGKRRLVSREGDITAATNEGVVYHLHFGQLFTGSEEEIEIGGAKDESKTDSEKKDDDPKEQAEDKDSKDNVTKSRYLFVRVEFNPSFLGDKPTEPTKPVKPGEEEKAKTDEKKDSNKKSDDKKDGDKKPDEKKSADEKKSEPAKSEPTKSEDSKTDDDVDSKQDDVKPKDNADKKTDNKDEAVKGKSKPADSADEKKESTKSEKPDEKEKEKLDPEAEYKTALVKYEQELRKYETDKASYARKEKKGKEQVEVLNARFADWYYVISSASFETLRLTREDLVTKKGKPVDEDKSKEASEKEKPKAGDKKGAPVKKPKGDDSKQTGEKKKTKAESKKDGSAKKADKKASPKNDTKSDPKKPKKADTPKSKTKPSPQKKKAESDTSKKKE